VPFEAEAAADVMQQQIHSAPVPPRRARPEAEITDAAEKLILKALSKRPEDRQQNMDELRLELQSCYGSVAYRRDAQRMGVEEAKLSQDLVEWMTLEKTRVKNDTAPEGASGGERPPERPGGSPGLKPAPVDDPSASAMILAKKEPPR
jgi:hypothetical protein